MEVPNNKSPIPILCLIYTYNRGYQMADRGPDPPDSPDRESLASF